MSAQEKPGKSAKVYRTWDDNFSVRSMTKEDLPIAQEWFSGLCPTSCDLAVAHEASEDGNGFYIGELNGEPVASTIRIPVAEGIFYGSYYYVKEEYRGRGFGRRIRDEVGRKYVGENLLVIDAHDNLLEMNKRYGYKEAFEVERVEGKVPSYWDESITVQTKEVLTSDSNKIFDYDDQCFVQANSKQRQAFLKGWLAIDGSMCVAALNSLGEFIGYGCRRPSFRPGYHLIGPLYADNYEVAYSIVRKLCESIGGENITLEICKPNKDACRLVQVLGLHMDFNMIRMYMNGDLPPISKKVFGLTSIDVCGF